MPLVQISIAQGRSAEQLRTLLADVHDAVVRSIDVPPTSVRVLISEISPSLWLSGGQTLAEKVGVTAT